MTDLEALIDAAAQELVATVERIADLADPASDDDWCRSGRHRDEWVQYGNDRERGQRRCRACRSKPTPPALAPRSVCSWCGVKLSTHPATCVPA